MKSNYVILKQLLHIS